MGTNQDRHQPFKNRAFISFGMAAWGLSLGVLPAPLPAQQSVARRWNEALLSAIRIDTPRPPVHARNLYHVSAGMYDAWATFDSTAKGSFVQEKNSAANVAAARNEAISYAAYRILSDRYQLSTNPGPSQAIFDNVMTSLGYDKNITTTLGNSPAAIGNRIAQQILDNSLNDGSNEANNYRDTTNYQSVNVPMVARYATVTDQEHTPLADPNRWQQLFINGLTAQNGQILPSNLQSYVAPHWGPVTTFAMRSMGPHSWSNFDPGLPAQLNGVGDARYRSDTLELIRMSNSLDPTQGPGAELINISPRVYGNRPLGTHTDQGYAANPVTGQQYADQFIKRADHVRILAEYWADGPASETPPGHWNVIANQVADNPLLQKRLGGQGPIVDNLEWDVKTYVALNGATHDAAVAAWGVKRLQDTARPITMVRYMGSKGQSSDSGQPSYHADGLPLETGLIELITEQSIAPGGQHRNVYDQVNVDHNGDFFLNFAEEDLVGKIAIHAWNGNPLDRENEIGGTGWILAENWIPYQLKTFLTPAFPGFVSGHSTFSRSAAEVLAAITGSPYFPGGLAQRSFPMGALDFEAGPTQDITLQWASYYDAADEAGISRRWGGIHPSIDDFPARILGSHIGMNAYRFASNLFAGYSDTDLNLDGSVDAADAGIFFANWGTNGAGDLNRDGIIDAADAGILFEDWTGDTVPSLSAVPEPGGVGAVFIVTLWAYVRSATARRRRLLDEA